MTQTLRLRETMPAFVRAALEESGLQAQYEARPPYQRNDYLLWINKARRDATKQKRLAQMLAELEAGGVYMNMKWTGREPRSKTGQDGPTDPFLT